MIEGHISKVKTGQKGLDIEWRFHLPMTGLVERNNEILKQQIKLLTGKTTLAGRTEVPSQVLTH